ncbi:flavin reductase family protein [Enterovirga rhinocerotis]|uniref:Flavin reductase (DIM6/NTAB) family NADH-FMN oxidoreductase RutF n=1 Tax=Enterovirga rhinocerotis TaxID=1339210 RepID=A0A4R7C7Y5_9HYPH|nr:flavin reductase family protein [Enterovirga rhinocerotis]TDR92946.1 flavin reductase (DIM6/NTAB) family NADH-FMN oxidoreductase RutF [Enterovirga rhinocerotis]
MFFDPVKNDHGLPRDPFKACIVPRPIGWISTISGEGVENLAPYSFFNAVSEWPRMVMVCVNGVQPGGREKDTSANLAEVPEFVVNMSNWHLREQMNISCAPVGPEIDEFDFAKVARAPARLVRPSLVVGAGISLECTVDRIIDLPTHPDGGRNALILGNVVGIHIDEAVMTEGRVDIAKLRPIARLGYSEYAVIGPDNVFPMRRPD